MILYDTNGDNMNIFYLDKCPKQCAEWMVNRHVVKMILETAQLLCTAHRVLDGTMYYDKTKTGRRVKRWRLSDPMMESTLYKATHVNHPSTVWCRENNENYLWLYEHFVQLLSEYKYRYNKNHKCEMFIDVLKQVPKNIKQEAFFDPPSAMDNEYKIGSDSIVNYRNYYIYGKARMHSWKKRSPPEWITRNEII